MIRLILIILILSTSTPAFALVIEFKKTADVGNVTVTLGDIADFDQDTDLSRALASQHVTQAPSIGRELKLKTQPVINHFTNNLNVTEPLSWRGSKTVHVTRSAEQISSADILTIIDGYLEQRKNDFPQVQFRFTPVAQPMPIVVPAGQLSWEVIPSDPDLIGSSRFSIIFSVDGRVRKNMSVRGKLEVLAQAVIAGKDIRRGSILRPQDLAMSLQDISAVQAPCLNPRQILGKKITSSIKAGEVVSVHDVELPPLVKKGELVHMIVKRGSLHITARGIARSDGAVNETIRVQNTGSKKLVYCRVTGPGVVEVTL